MGYTTIELKQGQSMHGVMFKGLSSDTISFNELLSGAFQDGDEIQLFKPETSTYDTYTFKEGGWFRGRTPADSTPVAPGSSFWIKTPGREVAITFKGAVKSEDFEFVAQPGIQMVATDIPVAFAINSAEGDVAWEGLQDGDTLNVLNSSGGYDPSVYSSATGKWMQGRRESTVVVPVGSAIWLQTATGGVSLKVANPVK